MTRALVAALAVMLLCAPVLPFTAASPAAAAPGGMATIPDSNVAEDVPTGESIPLSASELQGGVLASDHADSLEVVLTTAEHAPTVMGGDSAAVSGNGMAVVLRDSQQSAGREVALDAGQLQQALGYRPDSIYGTHEDGSTWTASAEYADGYLVFDVPHFSSNTVTFNGSVDLSLSSATDGTSISWSVNDYDSVSDVTVTATGRINTESESLSTTASNGATISADVAGNLAPTGPSSNGEPTVTLTGILEREQNNNLDLIGSGDRNVDNIKLVGDDGGGGVRKSQLDIKPGASGELTELKFNWDEAAGGFSQRTWSIDVRVVSGRFDVSSPTYGEGTLVKNDWQVSGTGDKTLTLDTPVDVQAGNFYHIELITETSDNDGDIDRLYINDESNLNGPYVMVTDPGGSSEPFAAGDVTMTVKKSQTDSPAVDIDGDGVNELSVSGTMADGETVTTEVSQLSAGDDSWSVDTAAGKVGVDAQFTERTKPVGVGFDINGQSSTVAASLSDGQVATTTVDNSTIKTGTNSFSASLDDTSLSADAPAMIVDYGVSHSATDVVNATYNSSTFEETYNISRTFGDATNDVVAEIPFASSRVVGVGTLEYRVNNGAWQSISDANYRFENTTVTAYVSDEYGGGLPAGATVEIRATGRKIDVANGAVTITDPTKPGEELDTQLQIDSRSEGFGINVGPTDDGDRVHYAYADNFPTEDYVVIDAAGNQQLHLPNAVQGDRFRVSHLDTRVVAETGDVRIDVVEAGENPELDVSPGPGGPGDTVTVEYYNTESGVTYLLNSLTRSIVIDSDTAQSPAIFEADDSDETWTILRDSGPSGSSSSGGGAVGQFQRQAADTVGSLSLPIGDSGLGQLALLGVLGLGGVLVLRRLFGDDDMAEGTGTASGGSGSGGSGLVGRATGLVGSLGSVGGRAARGAGSGLLAGLQRVLDFVGRIVEVILGNRRASIAAAVVAAIVAARVGLVQLPQGTGILIVVSGVPLATWLIMRRSGAVSRSVWLASTVAAVILGLEFVAPGTVQTAIEQLTSEDVAPLLILVGAGAAYLWYRSRQSDRPQIIIGGDDE